MIPKTITTIAAASVISTPMPRNDVAPPMTYAMTIVIWKFSATRLCSRTNGPRSLSTR
jgi:hypothetical protein